MAWMLNPADYDRLLATSTAAPPDGDGIVQMQRLAGSTWVSRDEDVAPGHIRDTDYPEIGCVTFAEFGAAYTKVLEDQRSRFEKSVELLNGMMHPLDPGTAEVLRRCCRTQ